MAGLLVFCQMDRVSLLTRSWGRSRCRGAISGNGRSFRSSRHGFRRFLLRFLDLLGDVLRGFLKLLFLFVGHVLDGLLRIGQLLLLLFRQVLELLVHLLLSGLKLLLLIIRKVLLRFLNSSIQLLGRFLDLDVGFTLFLARYKEQWRGNSGNE